MKNSKKRQFRTADGSPTLYMEAYNEYYHSKHGAMQEAKHVYLTMGLAHWRSLNPTAEKCHIFEMGFGTGLNAFLTAQKAQEEQVHLTYTTIEAFPLSNDEINEVNYTQFLGDNTSSLFDEIVAAPWEVLTPITTNFSLKKVKCLLQEFQPVESIDLVYYDAFGARSQPEVWEDDCFKPLVEKMNPGAVFVTYAAKGSVRRALQNLGLEVRLVPGPPGKREMIQAFHSLL